MLTAGHAVTCAQYRHRNVVDHSRYLANSLNLIVLLDYRPSLKLGCPRNEASSPIDSRLIYLKRIKVNTTIQRVKYTRHFLIRVFKILNAAIVHVLHVRKQKDNVPVIVRVRR